jgi:hypothetical protein
MQIWSTPFVTAEFADSKPVSQSFFGRIGNAELVRGVSDLYSISRMIDNQSVSSRLYEELSKSAAKVFDNHYWVSDDEALGIEKIVKNIVETAELVIDEFEKVKSIRQQSTKVMLEAEQQQQRLTASLRNESWDTAEQYVEALATLRKQRGHLTTIKDYRYIDIERIDVLSDQLHQEEEKLSNNTVTFLSNDESLQPYMDKIIDLNQQVEAAKTIAELKPLVEIIDSIASGLDLLS